MSTKEELIESLLQAVGVGVAMRRAQSDYFKDRSKVTLAVALRYEKDFDKLAAEALSLARIEGHL